MALMRLLEFRSESIRTPRCLYSSGIKRSNNFPSFHLVANGNDLCLVLYFIESPIILLSSGGIKGTGTVPVCLFHKRTRGPRSSLDLSMVAYENSTDDTGRSPSLRIHCVSLQVRSKLWTDQRLPFKIVPCGTPMEPFRWGKTWGTIPSARKSKVCNVALNSFRNVWHVALEMMEVWKTLVCFPGTHGGKNISASLCGSVSVSRKSGADELNHLSWKGLLGWRDSRCEMALTAPNWVLERSRNAPRHDQASLKITPRWCSEHDVSLMQPYDEIWAAQLNTKQLL